MPATVWHILNVKTIHLPDTEMLKVSLKKSRNHIKQTELNLCLAGFNHLKPLQVRDHGFQFFNCEEAGRGMGFRLLIWSTKRSFVKSLLPIFVDMKNLTQVLKSYYTVQCSARGRQPRWRLSIETRPWLSLLHSALCMYILQPATFTSACLKSSELLIWWW